MRLHSRPKIWTWLMLLILAVGIGCGKNSPARIEEGQGVASAFLDELRAGRIDPAWQATTVEFRSLMGADSLRDYVRTHPALKGTAEFQEAQPRADTGGRLVDYQFLATPPKTSSRSKTPPSPVTVRVMLNYATSPPQVERLSVE